MRMLVGAAYSPYLFSYRFALFVILARVAAAREESRSSALRRVRDSSRGSHARE